MSNDIRIRTVSNGAVLSYEFEDVEGGKEQVDTVFEYEIFEDDNEEELEGLIVMFYEILEQLGFTNSKHNRINIQINMEHGNAYECIDKKCEICRTTK